MADDVVFQSATLATPAANERVCAEEVSTLNGGAVTATKVQRVAPSLITANGTAVDVTTSNPMPVSDAGTTLSVDDGAGSLTVDGTVTANAGTNLNTSLLALEAGGNLAALAASASVLDDWDESDRAKVNPIVGQAGVAAGAGAVAATVQRVTLASDDPAVVSLAALDNAVAGSELQVDVVAALPAGTNNIGDVDVLTVNGVAPAFNTGTRSASTQRVTIATDDVVPASQSGTWNIGTVTTVTTVAAVTAISNALPAGTNNIGDVDVLSVVPGTAATSLGKAEDASHTTGDTGVMALGVRRDANTTLADTTGDYAPFQLDANGNVKVAVIAGGGTGGTSLTDEDAFTLGTTAFNPIGAVYNATPDTITDGDAGALQMTTARGLHVHLVDAAGASQSVGGGTQYTEDAAAAANPVGNALNLVRDDARGGSLTTTDGDNVAARGTNAGELYVKHVDAIPVTDNSGSLTVDNAVLSVVGSGTEATAQRVTIATDSTGVLSVDDNGASLTVDGTVTANAGTNLNTSALALEAGGNLAASATSLALLDNTIFADDAAFTVGTSSVSTIGVNAIAHGDPDSADAGDAVIPVANRDRVLWTIGGHPNIQTSTYIWTGSTTDDTVIPAISTGSKIAVTRVSVFLDEATTVGVGVRIGFGTANVPALGSAGADGVAGIVFYHPGLVPGSGFNIGDGSAVLGIGADDEDLRITAEATTGGTGSISVSWYAIAS